jgi:hypothetical protein
MRGGVSVFVHAEDVFVFLCPNARASMRQTFAVRLQNSSVLVFVSICLDEEGSR